MNDEIVEQLETKLAFLEKATNDLSDMLYRQQQDIAALAGRLDLILQRLDAMQTAERTYSAEEERPPHY
jgi:SlyX protein